MKICGVCKVPKELSEFHRCDGNLDGHQHRCKVCKTKYSRIRYLQDLENQQRIGREAHQKRFRENPDKVRETNRNWRKKNPGHHIKMTYGLSIEQWDEMMLNQGGMCAICDSEGKLCVDHDHATGKIRQLLCKKCNTSLGLIQDSVTIAQSVVEYLKKHL